MPASVVARKPKTIVLQIEVPIEPGNMLDLEDGLHRALNETGLLGTKELLQLFEPPNKDPIVVNQQKWSYKGKVLKRYETLYGCVPMERSVYQGVRGGVTLAPLDHRAGIVGSATPKFAKTLAWKYSQMPAPAVKEDFATNLSTARDAGNNCGLTLCQTKFYLIAESAINPREHPEN